MISICIQTIPNSEYFLNRVGDYHGKLKPDMDIGVGTGNLNIPKDIIEEWL